MTATALATDLTELFESQRRAFATTENPDHATRDDRLARLAAMTSKHADAVGAAISADFGNRSLNETQLAEIFPALSAISHARRHLKQWMRPQRMPTALHFRPGYSRVLRQPLGVVGIVSPWNYPYLLATAPAVGALAAGNRVMIKPSEITPRFSELLASIVTEFFAPEEMAVVVGDAETGRDFTSLPFDHLLFTGSTAIGRQVAQAAAKNLTPVTLELGGKSPAIIDASCNLATVVPKLAMGKLLNAGQTCIAPDYVLLPQGHEEAFLEAMSSTIARLYPTLADNRDYTSIVNERHFSRLTSLLDDARSKGARIVEINPGKESFQPGARKMPPCLVFNVDDSMALMQEEIFGPLLPVVSVPDIGVAIRYVNQRPRPLALYWFGSDAANRDRVLAETIAGGVTINDTLLHIAQEDLPFGGVGPSGQGAYHGEYGFLTFSKEKPVFHQSHFNGASLLYPPYGATFRRLLAFLKKII
jgi:coniferyl-aldehyde dehydrogenase